MNEIVFAGAAFVTLLFFYLGLGVWLFTGLILVSLTSMALLLGFSVDRIGLIAKSMLWRGSTVFEMATVPMFVWMGEIIYRTSMSMRLFRGLTPLVRRLPGRLIHTNIFGCTLFAAVSGSSTATVATMGRITAQDLIRRGYHKPSVLGSLSAAGSLGLLIPPSIVMIVYGILAEVSVARLFAASVLPGLMLSGFFALYLMAVAMIRPHYIPPSDGGDGTKVDWWLVVKDLFPVLFLIACVLGSIYTGLATPAESAAIGLVCTLALAASTREITWEMFSGSLMGTVRTSCMICSLVATAALLSTTLGYLHLPVNIARGIGAMNLGPWELLLLLALFYLLLGMFLDGISITVMTLPIALPLVLGAGFDPIWFAVYLVILIELAQITPPIGFNLFVLHAITREPIWYIALASLPFFLLMLLGLAVIAIFPEMVLVLPRLMF